MRERRDANRPRIVEFTSTPEVWVDGFGNVESLGDGVYRIPLYRIHRPPEGEGPVEHEIVAHVLANIRTIEESLLELRDDLVTGFLRHICKQVH